MLPLFYLENCGSTQDEILQFLERNPDGASVFTFNQTQGRGQYGNSWKSPEHLNLAYSIPIKTSAFLLSDILFNFRTAVIVRDFLAKLTNVDVKIKWPNDIIIGGKKVSGMLIEKRKFNGEDYFIAGIGLNILQENFTHLPKAGSVFTQTNERYDLLQFTENFHQHICSTLHKWSEKELILNDLNQNLFRKNEIAVFEIKGVRQNGIIQEADEDGFLWIDLENEGLQKFFFKEIEMLY